MNTDEGSNTPNGGNRKQGSWSLSLFGAPLDTGNLGVSALGTSVVEGAFRQDEIPNLTIFDNGWGSRELSVASGDQKLHVNARGARVSRRYHRPETIQTASFLARWPNVAHPIIRTLRQATAVADVSGGDSFTDMYGQQRFVSTIAPKKLALKVGRPLVLLPQTYGPYASPTNREVAERLVRQSRFAWARDERSYEVLRGMLGEEFDPTRHRQGVDMAFALSPSMPTGTEAEHLTQWLSNGGPVAGLNLSGLLSGPLPPGITRDPIAIAYDKVMQTIAQRVLAQPDTRLLLVPHVLGRSGETDETAIRRMIDGSDIDHSRVRIIPSDGMTANEAKWWISKCDWFCGARMHATIAALSSGVPTAALAYSIKTKPVFSLLGQEEHVVDARTASDAEAVDLLWRSWQQRDDTRVGVGLQAKAMRKKAEGQMDEIMTSCRTLVDREAVS